MQRLYWLLLAFWLLFFPCIVLSQSVKTSMAEDEAFINHLKALRTLEPSATITEAHKEQHELLTEGKLRHWAGMAYIIGLAHRDLGNLDSALQYHQVALKEFLGTADSLHWANTLNAIALDYKAMGEYTLAIQYLTRAMTLFQVIGSTQSIANVYSNIGNTYRAMGDYKHSLENHEQALQLRLELDNKKLISISYNNIGLVLSDQGLYPQALDYYQKSFDIRTEMGLTDLLPSAHVNLSELYSFLGKEEEALFHGKMGEELALKYGSAADVLGAEVNLGQVYLRAGKPDLALPVFEKVLSGLDPNNRSEHVWEARLAYGKCLMLLGQQDLAFQAVHAARQKAGEAGVKRIVVDAYQTLARYHENAGNPDSVRFYKLAYFELKDKIAVHSLELLVDDRAYLDSIQNPNVELQLQNAALREDRVHYLAMYGVIITLLVLTIAAGMWVLMVRYREQQKLIHLLNVQKEEIHHKNLELARSNQELAQFTQVVSHDLKQPLRTIGSFASLVDKRYHDVLDGPGRDYLRYIHKGVTHMHTILSDLLTYSQLGHARAPFQHENLNEVVSSVLWNLQQEIQDTGAQVQAMELPDVMGHRTALVQLIQNLVSNALKFRGKKPPLIRITCEEQPREWLFGVHDNGIGISQDDQGRVFQLFQRLHTEDKYPGTGIGLSICQRVVEQHGGQLWVESELNEGSSFYFTLPKAEKPVRARVAVV